MNKKYAIFGAAAAIAIAGVIYFGTGANQQASVAAIKTTAQPKTNTVLDERSIAIPATVYPGLEKEMKMYQNSIEAISKKLPTLVPSGTGERRRVIILGSGLCVSVGPLGGTPRYFECPF